MARVLGSMETSTPEKRGRSVSVASAIVRERNLYRWRRIRLAGCGLIRLSRTVYIYIYIKDKINKYY